MNLSACTGLFIAASVLYLGVFRTSPHPALFLDPHALTLVCGGTLAAALISLRFRQIEDLFLLVVYGFILKRRTTILNHAREVVQLALAAQNARPEMVRFDAAHPYLREAIYMLRRTYLNDADLQYILFKRNEYFRNQYQGDARALNGLAKFPPAFGLLGATTGMIQMMTNLGSGNQADIGPAMAVALVATFWGIAVANIVILPLADYANRAALDDQLVRQMIADGVMMIRHGVEPRVIADRIATHLSPREREALREVLPINIIAASTLSHRADPDATLIQSDDRFRRGG